MAFQRIPPLEPGERRGRLTFTGRSRKCPNPKFRYRLYHFICDCGREIWTRQGDIKRGLQISCGCVDRQGRPHRHWLAGIPEHWIWKRMIRFCHSPNEKKYPDYGGRGIIVCDEWRHSFPNFYADMGPRPSSQHSIERIDNDGPYSPENCRWATIDEQCRNTRQNIRVTFNGRTMIATDWAIEYGLPPVAFIHRIQRGWPIERALTTPIKQKSR